ncbi:MAG: hypothetical protein QM639_11600, partial [Rhodocyclaceae bacterium]
HGRISFYFCDPVRMGALPTDFGGCAVLSTNGTGNVLFLDKQASSNGNIDPGFVTMAQLPATGQVLSVQDGAYTERTIADLATSPTNDCMPPFVFSKGQMSAQCMNDGVLQAQTSLVKSQAPMPAGVLGIVSNGVASPMLLQLSPDAWLHVTPSQSFTGNDPKEPGSIGIFQRSGS